MAVISSTSSQALPPGLLLEAYTMGLFPMAMEGGELGWFSPDPRGIIPIADFHIPHGLRKTLAKHPFSVTFNTAFKDVMLGCADRATTWINTAILDSYCTLHHGGHAHSVEIWQEGILVGGLYGVAMGGAFFGESMFSRAANTSKIALHALVTRLHTRGYTLLDTQWVTTHLQQFGSHEIPRTDYLRRLELALQLECSFSD